MRINKKYAAWYKNITSTQTITPTIQIGVVYWGDTGSGNMVCGMLVGYEDGMSVISDARGKEHLVITSTLRSAH